MLIFQYKCDDCLNVFESVFSPSNSKNQSCVMCEGKSLSRVFTTSFYPNKVFCPHDKELDSTTLKHQLSDVLKDESQRCGGCGTDGAPGKCSSGGGGCSGSCGSCACKKKS